MPNTLPEPRQPAQLHGEPDTVAQPSRRARLISIPPHKLALGLFLLGGILRLYQYNTLSLWFDEGVSVFLARLPWSTVLGSIDQYDTHPPGYVVVLKLLNLLLPELAAVRLLSVVAGILTLPVLYALARRLMGTRAALLATAVLAFSPIHIWYSQEGRPYALTMLFVGLSYLALVAFCQAPRRWWALLYGLATLLAVYADYSALYALAPQALLFAYALRVHRRHTGWLWGAALAVGVLFLPWGVKMVATVNSMGLERSSALGVAPDKVGLTLLSLAGVAGHDHYFLGRLPTPWEHWPNWQWAMLLGIGLATVLGVFGLGRLPGLARLTVAGLLVGTILVGIVIGLYRPGFAERTVLSAVLGWALLIGAAGARWQPGRVSVGIGWRPVLRVVTVGSVGVILALSLLSLDAIYRGAEKDQWRELAGDVARVARFDRPLVTFHAIVPVLLDVYAPHALDIGHLNVGQGHALPPVAQAGADLNDAVWLVYIELPGIEQVRAGLDQQGYTRLLHNNYSAYSLNPIYMDLYTRPGAALTTDLPINGSFAGPGTEATGWTLPAGATLQPGTAAGRDLVLPNSGDGERRAIYSVPAQPHKLYVVQFAARAQLQTGRMRSFLLCTAADGSFARVAPDDGGATIANDGIWHPVSVSVMCPADTTALVVDLRNAGTGTVSFRELGLQTVSVHAPAP